MLATSRGVRVLAAVLGPPALLIAAALGWANLHSDDMGIIAGGLFLVSAAYGAVLGARRAWIAGAFFAAVIPASALASVILAVRAPFSGPPSWPEVLLPLMFGLAGAYSGAGIRALSAAE